MSAQDDAGATVNCTIKTEKEKAALENVETFYSHKNGKGTIRASQIYSSRKTFRLKSLKRKTNDLLTN